MSLTILSVAYPLAPVSKDAVGGAEQVLAVLDQALVQAGHRSIVIAAEGSRVAGKLVPVPLPPGPFDAIAKRAAQQATACAVADALKDFDIDLIHLHGVDFPCYVPPPGPPVLATLHLPPEWYSPETFQLARADTWLQCVSLSQHGRCPSAANLLPPIGNGVDLRQFRPRYSKWRFALTLGRICPEKGVQYALDAAEAAGFPLYVGGQVYDYEEHRRYFEQELRPRLRPPHRFLGPLGYRRKQWLLRAAACVLIPSLAPETSSLVAMEASACGTPVIAFPNGALTDIVVDGENGFLVADAREMATAIGRVGEIDGRVCRRAAERRFDVQATIESYFELYRKLTRRSVEFEDRDHHHQIRACQA